MKRYFTHAVLLSAAALFSCTADDRFGPVHGPGGGWPMMHYGYGGWFMWLILVIVIAMAIYFIVQAKRGGSARERPAVRETESERQGEEREPGSSEHVVGLRPGDAVRAGALQRPFRDRLEGRVRGAL